MAIIKIENSRNLKIGLLGFRQNLLEDVLKENDFSYVNLKNQEDITDEFDIIFSTGVYYIIKEPYLSAPRYGVYGFHETPVPEGAGHAPIQWTVLNGKRNMVITLFKMEQKFDTGQIAQQFNQPFKWSDTYSILEEKRQLGISRCFKNFIKEEFQHGIIVLREQTGRGSYSPKRSPKDSELAPYKSLMDLWDEIRICDNKKFPAFFILEKENEKIKVTLRYEVEKIKD